MPSFVFFPYRTAGNCITVETTASDGVKVKDGVFDASDPGIESAAVSIRCRVDPDALAKALPDHGDPHEAAELALRVISVTARSRSLLRADPGVFDHKFEISLERSKTRGELTLEPLVIIRNELQEAANFARDVGSIIAWAEPLKILIDLSEPPPGRSLPIEWRSFREDPDLADEHLFAVEQVGAIPTLLLNSDIAGAYEVLMSKGTHGGKARIRDATFGQIILQVWSSLVGQTWTDLITTLSEGEALDVDEAIEEMGGWEATVARDWAPYLFGEATDQAHALEMFVDAARDNDSHVLVGRVPSAIQQRFRTANSFSGLVRELHRFGGGEPDAD